MSHENNYDRHREDHNRNRRDDSRPWMRHPKSFKDEPEDFIEPKVERDLKREDNNREYFDSRYDRDYKSRRYTDRKRPVKEEVVQEEKSFFCGVCDHTSYSLESYNEHVVSVNHINRAARVFHFDLPSKKAVKQESKEQERHCEICDVTTNGDGCWQAHLSGAKHKKKEKQWLLDREMALATEKRVNPGEPVKITNTSGPLLVQTQKEFQNYPEPLIGLNFITEIQIPGEPINFSCGICDEKFTNSVKFSHITGIKHRLAVIKKLDMEWAKQLQEDCAKHSELSSRLTKAAAKLEEEDGRQLIKSRLETIHGTVLKRSDDIPKMPVTGGPPGIKSEFLPQMKGVQETLKARLLKRNQAYQDTHSSTMEFSGLPPPGIGTKPSINRPDPERSARKRTRSRTVSPKKDKSRSKSPVKSRSSSRKRKDSRSSMSSTGSKQLNDSVNRDKSKKPKLKESGRKSRSTSVSSKAKKREQARKMSSSSSSSSSSVSSSSSSSSSDDDSNDEVKRKKNVRSKGRPSTPPPPPADEPKTPNSIAPPVIPRVLDADTKKMVMQNLTELAKCCVTNEADAELALQVSNALTQALLQYRMRNMPVEVLQTIQAATPTASPVPTPTSAPLPPIPPLPATNQPTTKPSIDVSRNIPPIVPPSDQLGAAALTAMASVGPPPPRPPLNGFPVSSQPPYAAPLPGLVAGVPPLPPGIVTSQTRAPIIPAVLPNHIPPPPPRPVAPMAAPYVHTKPPVHISSSSYVPRRQSPGISPRVSGSGSELSSPPRSRDISQPRTPPLPRSSPPSSPTPPRPRPPQRGLPPQAPQQRHNIISRSSQDALDRRSRITQDRAPDPSSALPNGPNGSPYGESL